jgi:hypothetical protein
VTIRQALLKALNDEPSALLERTELFRRSRKLATKKHFDSHRRVLDSLLRLKVVRDHFEDDKTFYYTPKVQNDLPSAKAQHR